MPIKRPSAAKASLGRSKAAKTSRAPKPASEAPAVPEPPADPILVGCAPITEFIGKAGLLPDPCFEMVSAMLPCSLRTPMATCHEFQAEFIKHVTEILGSKEATCQGAVAAAEEQMRGLSDEKAAASAALTAAVEKSEAASKERDAKDTELNHAMKPLTEAEAALAAVEEKVKNLVPERTRAEERKADYKKACETLEELKAGAIPGKEWRRRDKAIDLVLKALELAGIEDSLKYSLPAALKAKPADIMKFGARVIEYTDQFVAQQISAAEEEILGIEEKSKSEEEALGAAKAALENAKEHLGRGQDEFIAADNKLLALNEDKDAAAAALAALEGQKTAELTLAVDAAQAQLAEVRDVMAKLQALQSVAAEPAAAAGEQAPDA